MKCERAHGRNPNLDFTLTHKCTRLDRLRSERDDSEHAEVALRYEKKFKKRFLLQGLIDHRPVGIFERRGGIIFLACLLV